VPHDVIHAHDWLTILAGIEAKKMSGKPLIFHVHALEEDRNWQHPNPAVQAIEKLGLHTSDLNIAVSEYTKKRMMKIHQLAPEKNTVVYNGHSGAVDKSSDVSLQKNKRFVVLFLGRITEQKGPYYFIKAAEKILSRRQDVDFIMAGDGDQLPSIIDLCARLGISSHVFFTGFLDRKDVDAFYQLTDVYVMPSVSEPFGLVCLEAIAFGIPVVISKQSGVSEVLTHALTVDYWDIDKLSEQIIALLDYPVLKKEMLPHAKRELAELTWKKAAERILSLYCKLSITASPHDNFA
jgi:glycosyltransferase involved in cell wall biosynthesis